MLTWENMRRHFFLSALLLIGGAIPSSAAVLPCVSGTLSSYIALGPAGCLVGSLEFGGFESLPLAPFGLNYNGNSGWTAFSTDAILVAPINSGLDFSFPSAFDQSLDAVFGFNTSALNANTITGETLAMPDLGGNPDSYLYGAQNWCNATVISCASGTFSQVGALDVYFNYPGGLDPDMRFLTQLTDQVSYYGTPLIGQTFNAEAVSYFNGSGPFSVAATFTTAGAPEPSTWFLCAGAVVFFYFRRRYPARFRLHS
jgi:hypothetical protein